MTVILRFRVFALIVLMLEFSPFSVSIFAGEIECIKVSEPPVIDGQLDDTIWKTSGKASGFLYDFVNAISIGAMTGELKELQGKPALDQTGAFISYDDKNLYFAFKCEESNPDNLQTNAQGHDDRVWMDDCVEFFIDIENTKKSYYHIIINSQGIVFDQYVKGVNKDKKGRIKLDADFRWDAGGQIATSVEKAYWIVEASFPLESFKLLPASGTRCGVNFTREQYSSKSLPDAFSSWVSLTGNFHQPESFGQLIFK